jgi:D-alanyl-D-alanine carboxypeptidase/D-alanyl-D-alanine-endopeptidase (penicillin-binding protein 4)
MENGSGLSRQTRVTASTLGGLLGHAWTSPWMPEYLASLALVGMDGTVRKHFRHAPETGHMHLKTGHLDNVAAVAGYVLARNGHTYVVTLLMNHPTVNQGSGNAFMDAVLKWTFQH